MTKRYDIETLLDEVVTLPSMPTTVTKLTELIDSPDCALSEVSQVISADPALAMKTLRLVNSAYYALSNEVQSIEHAVVLLGAKVIKNLALTATIFDSMSQGAEDFLLHCAATGIAMGAFCKAGAMGEFGTSQDEAFLFGLLHDVGRIILEESIPEEYAHVCDTARKQNIPIYKAEREIVGVDHAELGGYLAEKWSLSPPMIAAIAGHHDAGKAQGDFQVIAAALCLSDFTATAIGLPSRAGIQAEIPDEMWALTGLSVDDIPDILNGFFGSYTTITEFAELLS
jgi:HD-like signal output (HDOD) protein